MAGINLRQICKTYQVDGNTLHVLNGINLEVPEGKITILLGKSGCGKTTLLRITGGLEMADSGTVDVSNSSKMAYVFQEPRLMEWLTVKKNVEFGLKKEEINESEISRLIELVGLNGFEQAYPRQLSGGMLQRCAIARALAVHPDFVLMDEPFAALDYFTREKMQQEMIHLEEKEQTSILFVTHNIDEALTIGDRIAVIKNGIIASCIDLDEPYHKRDLMSDHSISLKKQVIAQLNG